jgi:hypothetical protein
MGDGLLGIRGPIFVDAVWKWFYTVSNDFHTVHKGNNLTPFTFLTPILFNMKLHCRSLESDWDCKGPWILNWLSLFILCK